MSIISSNHRLVKVEGSEYSAGPGIVIEDSTISVDPNLSAVIDDKLDISSFSSYSATIDDELQYVSANAGNTYSAGNNIDIYEQDNDLYISAKDWTTDIANASSYAFNEATAQIPPEFDPTYISGQIDNKLNKSDFDTYSGSVNTQISGLSGEFQTTSSLLDNKITAVRHDLNTVSTNTGYLYNDIQTTSGILSAAIDYVSANVGDEFPASANEAITAYQTYSGTYLTAHQDLSYISGQVDNKLDITSFSTVSGSFLTAVDLTPYYTTADANTLSSMLSGAIDYVSANAGDEFPASANEAITAYQNASGTFLTAHQSLDGYLTKSSADTLYQPIGSYASQTDLEQVSGDLKDDIDYISGVAITALPGDLATTGDISDLAQSISETYQPIGDYLTNADSANFYPMTGNPSGFLTAHQDISNKLDTTAFSTVSGTFLTAVDLSNYYTKSETSGATELADAFANIPAGDADVNAYVQGNSATIDNVNSTVQTNSAQWAEGTSVETIPVAVISPLVTGFSGESAYLGIESTALNLSSYVPVSAIGLLSNGYIYGISGRNISAMYSTTASYAYTANRAYHDRNNNEITSYYQPKLTITGDAGTITSINGSAVGASIPEGWELVAGQGIEIVDDSENNQTTISVTAAGGNPEVESYVQTNSASIDDAVSTYQSNSGSYITQETDWTNTITAASSYAYSEAVAQIPAPFDPYYMSGAIDQNASDIQYISGVAITAHQDISNKLDTTAFSDVSGSFLTAVNIPESASWNDATTAYQTNSASYLTAHQAISANEWNSNYETVTTNSGVWNDVSAYQTNSSTYMSEPNLEYNAVNEISAYNGSAIAQYGAEKQWLVHDDTLVHAANSAQYALGVNLSALQRLMGIDETVLFDGQVTVNKGNTAQLSESIHNFEYIKMIDNSLDAGSTRRLTTIPVVSGTRSIGTNDTWTDVNYKPTYAGSKYAGFNFYMIDEGGTTITTNGSYISHMGNSGAPVERNQGNLYKVIGIGRKQ